LNEYLGMLLTGDVHERLEWELGILAATAVIVGPIVAWVLVDLVQRGRRTRRTVRKTAVRVGQIEDEVVEKLRDSKPFAELLPEEEESK